MKSNWWFISIHFLISVFFFKLNVCSLLNQSVLILCDLIEEKYVVLSKHSKWFQATVTDILIRFCGVQQRNSVQKKIKFLSGRHIWYENLKIPLNATFETCFHLRQFYFIGTMNHIPLFTWIKNVQLPHFNI